MVFFFFSKKYSFNSSNFNKNELYVYTIKNLTKYIFFLYKYSVLDIISYDNSCINNLNKIKNFFFIFQIYLYKFDFILNIFCNKILDKNNFSNLNWYLRENYELFGNKLFLNKIDNRNLLLNYSEKQNFFLKKNTVFGFNDYKTVFNKIVKFKKISVSI